jgi:two-component system sensor histidine kinase UhpB
MNERINSTAMVTQLQTLVELEKASLARAIHDDMGVYLIASAMDVTLLRHRFSHDQDSIIKFDRLTRMLHAAIDVMRHVTEELQPTLLDNVGLFAALRWQTKHMCLRSSVTCNAHFPVTEPQLPHAAAIALFRAGQEALVVAEHHPDVSRMDFMMELHGDSLSMQVSTDGAFGPAPVEDTRGLRALGFLLHRLNALGGEVKLTYPATGGMNLSAQVLLSDALEFHSRPAL